MPGLFQKSTTAPGLFKFCATGPGLLRRCVAVTGRCCLPDCTCSDAMTEQQCLDAGGVFDVTRNCTDNPCSADTLGACCYPDTHCADGVTCADCIAAGGTWNPSKTCAQVVCSPQPCALCIGGVLPGSATAILAYSIVGTCCGDHIYSGGGPLSFPVYGTACGYSSLDPPIPIVTEMTYNPFYTDCRPPQSGPYIKALAKAAFAFSLVGGHVILSAGAVNQYGNQAMTIGTIDLGTPPVSCRGGFSFPLTGSPPAQSCVIATMIRLSYVGLYV